MQKYKEHSDAKRYKDHIARLARSIKAEGQQTPLLVVPADEGSFYKLAEGADRPYLVTTRYWLVDGHHRLEALQQAGISEAMIEVLPGLGFADALDASRLANQQIIQSLSPLERVENAWSAFNQERNTYRIMTIKESSALLGVSENTIKRFRDAVRKEGIAANKIDANAPRDKAEYQLQAYWQRTGTWRGFSIIPWHIFKKKRDGAIRSESLGSLKHIVKLAVIQTLFGEDGRYDTKAILGALEELGQDAKRPDAAAYLEKKYRPKSYQPDDGENDDDDLSYDSHALGLEVARMHAEGTLALPATSDNEDTSDTSSLTPPPARAYTPPVMKEFRELLAQSR